MKKLALLLFVLLAFAGCSAAVEKRSPILLPHAVEDVLLGEIEILEGPFGRPSYYHLDVPVKKVAEIVAAKNR